jgi:RNA polymerase sigma-70 factor (ECF subfamily)
MTALALGPRLMTNELAPLADPLRPLALAARDGETVAFTRLYERTREQAWRVLYRVVGRTSDLEDLVQEAYLQLMKALRHYRGDSKVSTFLHRVCVNVGLMYLRTKRRRPEELSGEVPENPAGEGDDPERVAQVRQAAALVQRALSTLSDEKAAVFVYHDLLGMKPEEISEVVDCPVNTVRSRLNRARQDFTQAVAKLKGGGR